MRSEAEILDLLRNATVELYQLGLSYEGKGPIPADRDQTSWVEAGPIRFGIESRILDPAALRLESDGGAVFVPDSGPSIHVFGTADGLEYLRFDCFEVKPHYHYIRHNPDVLITVRLDQHADGEPIDWALSRIRDRLPAMLEYAGVLELALAISENQEAVRSAVDEIAVALRGKVPA